MNEMQLHSYCKIRIDAEMQQSLKKLNPSCLDDSALFVLDFPFVKIINMQIAYFSCTLHLLGDAS